MYIAEQNSFMDRTKISSGSIWIFPCANRTENIESKLMTEANFSRLASVVGDEKYVLYKTVEEDENTSLESSEKFIYCVIGGYYIKFNASVLSSARESNEDVYLHLATISKELTASSSGSTETTTIIGGITIENTGALTIAATTDLDNFGSTSKFSGAILSNNPTESISGTGASCISLQILKEGASTSEYASLGGIGTNQLQDRAVTSIKIAEDAVMRENLGNDLISDENNSSTENGITVILSQDTADNGINVTVESTSVEQATDSSYAEKIGIKGGTKLIGDKEYGVYVNADGSVVESDNPTAHTLRDANHAYFENTNKSLVKFTDGVIAQSTATEGTTSSPVYLNKGILEEISVLAEGYGGTGVEKHEDLIGTNAEPGFIKPLHNTTGTATYTDTTFTRANNPVLNARTSTSDRYYALEMDADGRAFTNVPWVDDSYVISILESDTTINTTATMIGAKSKSDELAEAVADGKYIVVLEYAAKKDTYPTTIYTMTKADDSRVLFTGYNYNDVQDNISQSTVGYRWIPNTTIVKTLNILYANVSAGYTDGSGTTMIYSAGTIYRSNEVELATKTYTQTYVEGYTDEYCQPILTAGDGIDITDSTISSTPYIITVSSASQIISSSEISSAKTNFDKGLPVYIYYTPQDCLLPLVEVSSTSYYFTKTWMVGSSIYNKTITAQVNNPISYSSTTSQPYYSSTSVSTATQNKIDAITPKIIDVEEDTDLSDYISSFSTYYRNGIPLYLRYTTNETASQSGDGTIGSRGILFTLSTYATIEGIWRFTATDYTSTSTRQGVNTWFIEISTSSPKVNAFYWYCAGTRTNA